MTELLYRTPPPHLTHHDPTFFLSSAIFTFDLTLVLQEYRKRIASYDKSAAKYIVGPGDKREREGLASSLMKLEAITDPEQQLCPDFVATNFASAMGNAIYDRFISVRCYKCDKDYMPTHLEKVKWVVDNGDGSGSSGSRLACPNGHYLYASVESVMD